MEKEKLNRLGEALGRTLDSPLGEEIIKTLIMRKWALDENRPDSDDNWEHFKEWEALENWMEDAQVDFMLDNDGVIHLAQMEF